MAEPTIHVASYLVLELLSQCLHVVAALIEDLADLVTQFERELLEQLPQRGKHLRFTVNALLYGIWSSSPRSSSQNKTL
jgi:hypothetical protein